MWYPHVTLIYISTWYLFCFRNFLKWVPNSTLYMLHRAVSLWGIAIDTLVWLLHYERVNIIDFMNETLKTKLYMNNKNVKNIQIIVALFIFKTCVFFSLNNCLISEIKFEKYSSPPKEGTRHKLPYIRKDNQVTNIFKKFSVISSSANIRKALGFLTWR